MKTNPLQRSDLDEFVTCYHAENRHERKPTWSEANVSGRWRPYAYDDIIKFDKCSLDIFWLRDESLEKRGGNQVVWRRFDRRGKRVVATSDRSHKNFVPSAVCGCRIPSSLPSKRKFPVQHRRSLCPAR